MSSPKSCMAAVVERVVSTWKPRHVGSDTNSVRSLRGSRNTCNLPEIEIRFDPKDTRANIARQRRNGRKRRSCLDAVSPGRLPRGERGVDASGTPFPPSERESDCCQWNSTSVGETDDRLSTID